MFSNPRKRHMTANIVPQGGALSAPRRPRGAFGGPPKRRNWADALGVLGGTLMDLDGTMGRGNQQASIGRVQDQRAMMAEQERQKRMQEAMAKIAPEYAGLSPQDRGFIYGMQRDQVGDQRYERQYGDQRTDRQQDVQHRDRVFDHGVNTDARDYGFRVDEAQRHQNNADRGFEYAAQRDGVNDEFRQQQALHGQNMDYSNLEVSRQSLGLKQMAAQAKLTQDAAKQNKPLIGAESMGKVAAGLPNMKRATSDLKGLMTEGNPSGMTGGFAPKEGGYRPGHDWGARAVNAIPDWGLLKPVAKSMGGKDYQQFEQAYSDFEAAALPIMSGAAVSESEAKRTLNSIRIEPGDNDETIARKLRNMDNMTLGLEAAANGDTEMLQQLISGTYDYGAQPAPDLDPEIEALLDMYGGG